MVTYEMMFQIGTFIVAVISLVINITKKK